MVGFHTVLVLCTLTISSILVTSERFLNASSFNAILKNQYNDTTFYCEDGIACVLNCSARNACSEATIIGPYDASLTVNCNSWSSSNEDTDYYSKQFSCQRLTIDARDSSVLYINAYNENYELYDTEIWTPTDVEWMNGEALPNTFIVCGILTELTPDYYQYAVCGRYVTVYSLYGWSTISWEWTSDEEELSDSYGQEMNCGTDYNSTCDDWKQRNDNKGYLCKDRGSVCNSLGHNASIWTTPVYTINNTWVWTYHGRHSNSRGANEDAISIVLFVFVSLAVAAAIAGVIYHSKRYQNIQYIMPPQNGGIALIKTEGTNTVR